jgi:hypothetical protein
MKRIYTASNLPEAHLLLHLLESRGIRARIFSANASSLAGEIPVDHAGPQLWVDDPAQADRAREAIDEYLRASPRLPPRKCPACGEENPGTFEICWSCGASLPA